MNNLLTIEEVKTFLEINEEQLEKYLTERKLRAYKIGGTYLRFRKEEVINLRSEIRSSVPRPLVRQPIFSKLWEFWHFNNFYIISTLIVVVLIAYFLHS